jgi:hypothetical protein
MKPEWHLIIVDDREEFAFYCWRYLTGSIGIMSASIPPQMLSPDGTIHFHFIQLKGEGDKQQQRLLDRVHELRSDEDARTFLIVDVFAKDHYPRKIIDVLGSEHEARLPLDRGNLKKFYFQIVSAHPFDPRRYGVDRIEPKSIEYLKRLRGLLVKEPIRSDAKTSRHILVTGAGFEMRGKKPIGDGIDDTGQIMLSMPLPFGHNEDTTSKADIRISLPDGWKLPMVHGFEESTALNQAAKQGNLDGYWDALLRFELYKILYDKPADAKERAKVKMRALRREMQLRDAFRRAFLRFDVGFLSQALDAAHLDWHAWLTTNYTHFADRAVETVKAHVQERNWQIVASVSEALVASTALEEDPRTDDRRILFKLHGDLAHLQTMAIAGEDKDPVSEFPFPVDKLHWLYDAATRYLGHTLSRDAKQKKVASVVWHIVGHALWDYPLLSLLKEVVEHLRAHAEWEIQQSFVIVDLAPSAPKKRLTDHITSINPADVCTVRGNARSYIARLRQCGFPLFERADWRKEFEKGGCFFIDPEHEAAK